MCERAAKWGGRALVAFWESVGTLFSFTGRLDRAKRCHERAVRASERSPLSPTLHATTLMRLGVVEKTAGLYDQAEAHYRHAGALMTRSGPVPAEFAAALAHNLAGLALARGDAETAEAHARSAVATRREMRANSAVVARDEAVLAATIAAQGRDDEARDLFRTALGAFEGRRGPELYESAVIHQNLGALERRHDPALALRHYERALAIKQRVRGPKHPEVAIVLNNLGALHREQGRDDLARKYFTEALPLLRRRYGTDHPATLMCQANLDRTLD